MQAVIAYNPHDNTEKALIEQLQNDLTLQEFTDIRLVDFQEVREIFPVSATPALVIIRDDLQGERLLMTNPEDGRTRVMLEVARMLTEREKAYNNEIDMEIDVFNQEIHTKTAPLQEKLDILGPELVKYKLALKKAGVTL